MRRKIDISHRTVIFITCFLLGLWLTYLILDILLVVFVAIILMSALAPFVNFFIRLRVPKGVSIALAYIIILACVGGILVVVLPPLVEQSTRLISTAPALITQQLGFFNIDRSIVQSELTNLSKNLLSFSFVLFNNAITMIFLLVMSFYMLLERENLEKRAAELFIHREVRVRRLILQIEEKLGAWVRGQIVLSLLIGVSAYIGLSLLNVPYALPLAILSGILEVVPVIGPILASLPAILLALNVSPVLGIGVAAMFFVIQQLESHVIVPQVMKRAVGLNPLAVILAIAIGGRLLGITGAFLAVPITVVIQILVTDVLEDKIEL